MSAPLILGSQSPRRLELLSLLAPQLAVQVIPVRAYEEPSFQDCADLSQVDARLIEAVRGKAGDVRSQLADQPRAILTADTVIIAGDAHGRLEVLGKPPEDSESYRRTVRRWFLDLYDGRTHWAKTAVRLETPGQAAIERIATTEVVFQIDSAEQVDWYIATKEPRGKAGGYAIQGAGSLFVSEVRGSLSNVVGLPLRETQEMLRLCGLV